MSIEIIRGSAKFRYGMSNPKQFQGWLEEHPEIIGFSMVGRSNVGKSSLINALFGNKLARTSNTPGRTREINIFEFQIGEAGNPIDHKFWLFDLPGYGYAKVNREMSKKWEELMQIFFQDISEKVNMINIQDARHPNQKADIEFHQFLKNFECETTLVFNKLDKLKKQKERSALNKLKPTIYKDYKWVKDIHFVSAEKGAGLKSLHDSMVGHLLLKSENE
ncbi:MAG: ribosome biogenesis GTP-binding protein YsxC [Bacteriovoracaceae bacterium]|jgi:GTP-binding protein|nr:ribosome biogenesis GTP-binding protein YsxC [Bacteriovoracaceae bacterium]